ncbi:MAG: bifunctional glycosyltransferase/class I SAM-dependent methyltransferase, partial [Bdellovibrio sp.]
DQDSLLSTSYVSKMKAAYLSNKDKDSIGILAPRQFDKSTGYQSKDYQNFVGPSISKDIVMTSGNLIPLWVFNQVGLFDEDLFIEYVDHDFCLRVKKSGLKTILVADAHLGHSLGKIRQHRLFPGVFFFSHNYHPVRRYYRARNRVILYRRHWGTWILQDQEFAIKDMIKILLVEEHRWEKVKATVAGTFDALLGRLGAYEGATYTSPKAAKYFVEFREEILPLIPEKSSRVLDLGCGSGETSGHLKKLKKFDWVCGVENSPEAAAIARVKLDQVLVGNIEAMDFPFQPESFDLILALDILEHLVDPWSVVQKLKDLLRPDGVLVVSLPNVRHYHILIPLIFRGDWRYSQEGLLDSTHIRFFTKKTAMKMFLKAGFALEKWDHTGAKKGFSSILNFLTLGFFKDFFVFQNIFCFRKPKPSGFNIEKGKSS